MKPELPLPWTIGVTLRTPQTKNWTREQIDENNEREARLVFSSFSSADLGRARQCVAQVTGKQNAAYIAHAANAYPKLVAELKRICNELGPLLGGKPLGNHLLRELGEDE